MSAKVLPKAEVLTLIVHLGDSIVPSAQTLSVGGEVVATDGDTSADHGVDHRPSVSHHEYELAVGEELLNV